MTSRWDITTGPGLTALGLAAARSVETGQPDRLIVDPFARELFSSIDAGLPMLLDWPDDDDDLTDAHKLHLHGSRYIGLRTRYYDDALLAATTSGIRQVVLLGAGLDTRAFRLQLPRGLSVYEIDQAGVLTYKADVLARNHKPCCGWTLVDADLSDEWVPALLATAFRPARSTVWIGEGLLPYLNPTAQAQLITDVIELSAPGSRLAFDNIVGDPASSGRLNIVAERSGINMQELLARGAPADLPTILQEQGWDVDQEVTAQIARRYSRDLHDPFEPNNAQASGEAPWLDTRFIAAHRPTTRADRRH